MKKLMTERYPVYEGADLTVESRDVPHDVIVGAVIDALAAKLGCEANAPQDAKARQEAKAHQEHSRKKVQ
jgi:hypothetical protein